MNAQQSRLHPAPHLPTEAGAFGVVSTTMTNTAAIETTPLGHTLYRHNAISMQPWRRSAEQPRIAKGQRVRVVACIAAFVSPSGASLALLGEEGLVLSVDGVDDVCVRLDRDAGTDTSELDVHLFRSEELWPL